MKGDFQTASNLSFYIIGFDDELEDAAETPPGTKRDDQRLYWQGVADARNGGHICTVRMKQPREETKRNGTR